MRRGLTLIEVLIGTALFAMIASALYFSFANILEITTQTKVVASAMGAIQSQIEVIRNMQFQDVGIQGGWPSGKILAQQVAIYDGTPFVLTATVRNIDDPFDGTLGGAPNDTAPADYKLVEIQASCPACAHFVPIVITARVAPDGLETTSNNGSLFVNVFDANGVAVSGANVTVQNMSTTPTITINDTTNVNGMLQLIDIPTSSSNYK
jgi:prepilin-type N-terminal cleavage/methylation domain-containing protein